VKTKSSYPEFDKLKDDLGELRSDVVELTKHIKSDGRAQAAELKKRAQGQMEVLQDVSKQKYAHLEDQVKEKPGQALALAFLAGVAANFLLGRR
jgi:ElaB/YqjD/DUF883 family membrane-anchored ribosome-binding protein